MGRSPTTQAQDRTRDICADQIWSEIEAIGLDRMQAAGGTLARLGRLRSLMSEALGIIGTVSDIIDMANAGYEAMTTPRRMIMRIAAAHGFGYWVFQESRVRNPRNPPNAFLIMHRDHDRADARIGQRIGNPDFSSDGGLTSYDWNIIWQTGVQQTIRQMDRKMQTLVRTGRAEQRLNEALPGAQIHAQHHGAIPAQYRAVIMSRKFGRAEAAAGAHFLASLKGINEIEQQANLSLYRRFPYRG